uniref:RNA-directed DNA polymerase, eukaryota n=1 Tax=Tanacetum cinerariifolium TaxID=118510 RepID=A0A6L2MTD8_TANCI|nr:RNA-directed DNA polymerase, eukaryota [Tanacetum cinerariifolium]
MLPQTIMPLNLRADEAVNQEEGDRVERAIITDASLEAAQDSDNIIKTQTMAMPNVDIPQGIDTGGSPRRQETMGGTSAQTRSKKVLEQPNEPPLPEGGYTPGSDESRITLSELIESCATLSKRVTQLENELSTTKAIYNKAFITLTNRGRIIKETDKDENINLVSEQGEVQETIEHSIDDDDETLAETLLNIKRSSAKDKGKGIMQEQSYQRKEARQEQERYNFEKSLELQRQLDQRKENVSKEETEEEAKAQGDSDQDVEELKLYMRIIPEEDIAIEAIPLAIKPPMIIEEDLKTLWNVVKDKYGHTRLEEGFNNLHIFLLVDKLYPFTPATIKMMLEKKLQADQYSSKEEGAARISTSIYVTNFPKSFSAKDLFNTCKTYGYVVDSYIPFKKSKAGKRFGFVRFINVFNEESKKDSIYQVKIVNGSKSNSNIASKKNVDMKAVDKTYAQVFTGNYQSRSSDNEPTMVLDEDCVLNKPLDNSLLGRVKEIASLSNLKKALSNEGFDHFKLHYMGEFWVLIEFDLAHSKKLFQDNTGVRSWFSHLKDATLDFYVDGRIIWVEIEGVPFRLWSSNTFKRIAFRWGDLLDMDGPEDTGFHSKRLCLSSKLGFNIFENFKINFRSKAYWIRTKEVPGWVPNFSDDLENEDSDTDSKDGKFQPRDFGNSGSCDIDGNTSEIPETIFEAYKPINYSQADVPTGIKVDHSEDPFNIYPLFNKKNVSNGIEEAFAQTPNFPPGFTPPVNEKNDQAEPSFKKEDPIKDTSESVCSGHFEKSTAPRSQGSILNLMEELIKAKKDWVKELCIKHKVNFLALQETKMESIDLFTIRSCWGNLGFEHVHSDSVGNSGGILCVWDLYSLRKISSTVSDYFVMIRGVWMKSVDDFSSFVKRTWIESPGNNSNAMCNLLLKLKSLKVKIREWNKQRLNITKSDVSKLKKDLKSLDKEIDNGGCSSKKISKRAEVINSIQEIEKLHSMELAQKAKINWCVKGNENSHFFHGMINKRQSQMSIRGIMIDGVWTEDPSKVKSEFFEHFSSRFAKPVSHRDLFNIQFLNTLTLDQQSDLERGVTKEELKKRFWTTIKDGVLEAVKYFFNSGDIPTGYNSLFIVLIPKIPDANLVKDFRPISLIGSIYKVIAKLLANRLVRVLGDIINEVQSAFIADRQILDGPFILNEMLQWCKLKKKQSLIFKVDFEKAFDSIRWDFLDDVLKNFGFGGKWCNWIQSCLNSSRGSILINGNPTKEFNFQKGLKQGDPLSLFCSFSLWKVFTSHFNAWWTRAQKWVVLCLDIKCGRMSSIRKATWIKWDYVLTPKEKGGLGVSSLYALNNALMLKWVWKFHYHSSSLWTRVMKAIHGEDGKISRILKVRKNSCWLNIVNKITALNLKGIKFFDFMRLKVGNRNNISFWYDKWIGDTSLHNLFPRIFALENNKQVVISAKLDELSLADSFRHLPRGGDFIVASIRFKIDNTMLSSISSATKWIKSVPIKVNNEAATPSFVPALNVSDKQQIWANIALSFVEIRTSLTRFPAQSVRSSNAYALDSPYFLVLNTGTSQSKQHVDTSLIDIESRKSPTKSLFDVGSSRISIFMVNT